MNSLLSMDRGGSMPSEVERRLRIGIDATCWGNGRGYGRHARSLLTHLIKASPDHSYTLVTDSPDDVEAMPAEAERHLVKASSPTRSAAAADGRRSVLDMLRMSLALSQSRFDVVFFPTIYSYVPVFSRAKTLVTIHDVIPESYPELTLPSRKARYLWRAKVAAGCYQASALVTVSEFSKKLIVERLGVDRGRIHVVGEASDPVFRRMAQPRISPQLKAAGVSTDGRIVVYVGGCNPHKNLEMLISVFAQLVGRDGWADLQLVLVGDYQGDVFHSYFERIVGQVNRAGLQKHVLFTGRLPDEDLVILLNLAATLVLPSLMEGFGLPAVEAAACGCPVIATRESPLPELLGGGGVYVDPQSPADLEAALVTVLSSAQVRERLGQAGEQAARELSWDAAAHQLRAVLRQVTEQ